MHQMTHPTYSLVENGTPSPMGEGWDGEQFSEPSAPLGATHVVEWSVDNSDTTSLSYDPGSTSACDSIPSAPLAGEVARSAVGGCNHRYYAPYIKEFARQMRNEMTSQEVKLWQHIRREQLGVKFRRQCPIDSKYIADFACLEKKIIIEIDGGQHNQEEDIKYDNRRTEYLNSLGYKVLRFWNNDIDKNINGVYTILQNEFGIVVD